MPKYPNGTVVNFRPFAGSTDLQQGKVVGHNTKRLRGITTRFLVLEVPGQKRRQMIHVSSVVSEEGK